MPPFQKYLALTVILPSLILSCGDSSKESAPPVQVPVPPTPAVEMVDLLMWEWDRGDVHEVYASDMTDGLASRVTCARGWDRMPMGDSNGTHIYFLSDRGIYEGHPGRRLYRRGFNNLPAQEVHVGDTPKDNYDAYAMAPPENYLAQILDGDYPTAYIFDLKTGTLMYTKKGCWAPTFSRDGTMLAMSCIPVLRDRRDPWDPVRVEILESSSGKSLFGSAGWSQPADPEKAKIRVKSGEDGATYNNPRFSPDGTRVAYSYYQPGSVEKPQVHVRDLKTNTTVVLTAAETPCLNPVWSPNGKHLFYLNYSKEGTKIMRILASGGIPETFGPSGGKIRNLSSFSVPKQTYQTWRPCASVPEQTGDIPPGVTLETDPKKLVSAEEPKISHKLRARFEYQLSLAGFGLDRIEPEPKHLTLLCRILFEVHSRPPGNFEVGIELKSKDHTITKKFAPLPGDLPPYMWTAGQWVRGEYLLPVGYDIPPGTYFITMWLYSPRGNIPIVKSDGHLHTAENKMPLGSIVLK
jgi:hypothetical protein